MHIHTIWARLDGPDTGALLPEVVACSLQQGPKSGSMGPVCVVAAAVLAREDDIDIGGCVLEVLLARVGVGHLLLHGGGVVLVLLPPRRWWWDTVIFWLSIGNPTKKLSIRVPSLF